MPDIKKTLFNADAAEEYFSMLLTSYRDTANDIFRRDNEGRHASEQHYSPEYQKHLGMQIAMREVLEYFGKYELGYRWISVEERLPDVGREVLAIKNDRNYCVVMYSDTYKVFFGGQFPVNGVTHWMPLPEPPKGGEVSAP